MGRLIDAERKVHIQIYDDEHEEYRTHEMSIADVLDTYTDEGCPDAESSAQQWITCSNCARNADNGGLYPDGRTRCPIQEHYELLKDGYCHLAEPWKGEQE